MKTILSLILLCSVLALTSCYKKGCTDQNANNYDSNANTGDPCWECDYNGSVLFYFNNVTRDSLIHRGVTSISINASGQLLGPFPINSTTEYPNTCDSGNPMKIERNVGRSCYLTYISLEYTVTDQNGNTLWSNLTTMDPKYCSPTELHF